MELYTKVSREMAELLTKRYSTSFSSAARLYRKNIRGHIYSVYGLVRIADEIVDTYRGDDQLEVLDDLELEVNRALETSYSANPLVHAFCLTSNEFGIDKRLIAPFFESMRMDTYKINYSKKDYQTYIYGSAEVIGLMCLRVFINGDIDQYNQLKPGAQALGSAFQKINFLRDIASDNHNLGRMYFPDINFDNITEKDQHNIIKEIRKELTIAHKAMLQLPRSSQPAVRVAYEYYSELLNKISKTPIRELQQQRTRISNTAKLWIFIKVRVKYVFVGLK